MALGVGALEIGDRELGVVLERVQGFMAEQFLEMVHACPASQHLGGAASPAGKRPT